MTGPSGDPIETTTIAALAPGRFRVLPTGAPARRPGRAYAAVNAAAALILILLTAPVLIAVAIAVKLDGGPVLSGQTRVGLNGREFTLLTFRSVRADDDGRLAASIASDDVDPLSVDEPRVTALGRVLRRYSIDEMPQLFNVVGGTMALVGPRPALPREAARFCPLAARRLEVKPGLTGLVHVTGRSDLTGDQSIRIDAYYVDTWSPALDLHILVRTAGAVLRGDGAC